MHPDTLPPHWSFRHAPDAPAGAPPRGSIWAVDATTGAATEIATSEAETIDRAWALRDRLDRMLADMQERRAAYFMDWVSEAFPERILGNEGQRLVCAVNEDAKMVAFAREADA